MKILLLGHGQWGQIILKDLIALKAHVDVVDPDETARRLSIQNGARSAVASSDVLEQGWKYWDGIVLATPTSLHGLHLQQIWHAGIPIFCEKPLFASLQEFDLLHQAPSNMVLHAMHIWQAHPAIEAIAAVIAAGRIGKLLTIRTERLGWTSPRRDVGAVANLLIHDLTILERFLGHQDFKMKSSAVERDAQGMDRWAQVTFETDQNVVCSVEIGNRSPLKSRLIRVQGSDGVICFDESRSDVVHLWIGDAHCQEGATRKEVVPFASQPSAMKRQLQTWLTFLQGGPEPSGSTRQALKFARLAHQILDSNAEN